MSSVADDNWREAQRLLAQGNVAGARAALGRVASLAPTNIHAHLLLGGIAWKEDRPRDAAQHALDAAQYLQQQPEQIASAIAALLQVGEAECARRCLHHPALHAVVEPNQCMRFAGWAHALGDHLASQSWYERASASHDGAELSYQYATQLSFNGHFARSEEMLERCVTMPSAPGRAYVELARLRKQTPTHNHIALIESRIAQAEPQSEHRAALEFARYKALEDLGQWDAAWRALCAGNAIMASRMPYERAHDDALFAGLRRVCTPEFLSRADRSEDTGPQPIFIVGLPRSGTTLLDRLLGAHPDVASAGELRDFGMQLHWTADHRLPELLDTQIIERLPQLDFPLLGRRYLDQTRWRAHGKRFFIDKLPPNWQVAGLIARALPHAKILHLVRDPVDVCFSLYRALFGPSYAFSYDQRAIAAHHGQYRELIAHWHAAMPGRILDVAYADLVRDPASSMHDVLSHCGLAWNAACIDVNANRAPVATLSFAQARGAIDNSLSGAWRHYEAQLAPLLDALATAP